MASLDLRLKTMRERLTGSWGARIFYQLAYARQLSRVRENRYDERIGEALDFLEKAHDPGESVTRETVLKAEETIHEIAPAAKEFEMVCAAHAHIDMNWQWRYDETVAITLDTFRTMLDLMREYPDFTFSQSQASVYRIVERFAPSMLEEIRERAAEGRWEVTASTWVETDKNMPSGESLARHILYTRRYLSDLLDLDPDSLDLDFEPDTFGHSTHVPEILTRGGVRYYYHCRGYDGHNLYRWRAPSGSEITVYREPLWYNAAIEPEMALHVPAFCHQHGMRTMLKVYGVGDHGGGPTRRDLERIESMNDWPVFPRIRFGTFGEYFEHTEKVKEDLPTVEGELNFIFTGCYTTQSRIKEANRVGEQSLYEAELFNSLASISAGMEYSNEDFASAWKKVLFNQFHDILPGSGTIDTREHARGIFQEALAVSGTRKKMSLARLASRIDTASLVDMDGHEESGTVSEGAGVGFGIEDFNISQTERGTGTTRVLTVFNPSPFDRCEPVEAVIWDWPGDTERLDVRDENGKGTQHQILDSGTHHYWGHQYLRLLFMATVPAGGYRTYILEEGTRGEYGPDLPASPRVEGLHEFVLENEHLRVSFDPQDGSITSLVDRARGENLVDPDRKAGVFRLIEEDDSRGMTSWIVGRYMHVESLTRRVKIKKVADGPIRQALSMELSFRDSNLKAGIALDQGSPVLRYSVECDWQEKGQPGAFIPQLGYFLPLNYKPKAYRYDVPFGTIEREGMDRDVPANSWALGRNSLQDASSLMLITDSKYGFRSVDRALSVTLIRGAFDPDPYPELGQHSFGFGIAVANASRNRELIRLARGYNHPLSFVSVKPDFGDLPPTGRLLEIREGTAALSSFKRAEEGTNRYILRLYETEGERTRVTVGFGAEPASATHVDINEQVLEQDGVEIDGRQVSFELGAHTVTSIMVEF